ncbi:polygalacturonase-like [Impatiens glandulifera]|uniref:polygalacturonase-like n=1 Tax=Impatiens glandulifera TaxID=253017 RepID=UPI001FB16B72|nr:polygalacturonase-like [Impatiens glandulifera]
MAAPGAPTTYNVVSLGAEPNGLTDSSKAFLKAWALACSSPDIATISVPKGRYLISSTISFVGDGCESSDITFRIDGTLVAPSNYGVLAKSYNWIVFKQTNGVSIYGGNLDAKGSGLWACKNSGDNCPSGATSLQFSNSKNVLVSGLTSLNSQMFHMVILGCNNVKLQGIRITADGNSQNTDGIHISQSSDVKVMNSKIGTGDDCISIGPGSTNLWMEGIVCGPGHGISIGSLGRELNEDGVQNVTVNTATFVGTQNGVRIKSWEKQSSGFVKDVLFQHVTMFNVLNPIIIDQHYCNGKYNCPRLGSGIKVSDVTYNDIHGTSASELGVNFDCNKNKPCSGITLKGVDMKFGSGKTPVKFECLNVVGGSCI